jgi:hypothetical protein
MLKRSGIKAQKQKKFLMETIFADRIDEKLSRQGLVTQAVRSVHGAQPGAITLLGRFCVSPY